MKTKVSIHKILRLIFIINLVCIFSSNIYCQKNDEAILEIEKIRIEIKEERKQVDSLVKMYNSEINILKKDREVLSKLRQEKNYFSSILRTQTGIFSAITTGFFILFGLLTYGGFRREVKTQKEEYQKRLKKQQKKTDDLIRKLNNMRDSLYGTQGNTNRLIADFFNGKNEVTSFIYKFRASISFFKYNNQSEPGFLNLKQAVKSFKAISMDETNKADVLNEKESIEIILKDFEKFDNKEIKDLCAELRVMMNNYLK